MLVVMEEKKRCRLVRRCRTVHVGVCKRVCRGGKKGDDNDEDDVNDGGKRRRKCPRRCRKVARKVCRKGRVCKGQRANDERTRYYIWERCPHSKNLSVCRQNFLNLKHFHKTGKWRNTLLKTRNFFLLRNIVWSSVRNFLE